LDYTSRRSCRALPGIHHILRLRRRIGADL
jgi:hypothetical protein